MTIFYSYYIAHLVNCTFKIFICRLQSYLQTQHLKPEVRALSVKAFMDSRGLTTDMHTQELTNNDKCYSHGMDQGIHNWLLRSGLIDLVIRTIVFS